jgi:hypothetical protein
VVFSFLLPSIFSPVTLHRSSRKYTQRKGIWEAQACPGMPFPKDCSSKMQTREILKGLTERMMVRIVIAIICLFLTLPHAADALQMIQRDGIYLYYPKGQYEKASGLLKAGESVIRFLDKHGLQPKEPMHIILDDLLDEPKVRLSMIPHREIRIPLRAPGVLEDGSSEADPWFYFLFMGLTAQGIYSERSGIPGHVHRVLGEIISPNLILPEWSFDGIGALLYEKYMGRQRPAGLYDAIFATVSIPDLDFVSNYPDVWPGRFSYRIFGRPFIQWLDQLYGWDKLLLFIQMHGRGIFPVDIDSGARAAFGKSWYQLWQDFRDERPDSAPERFGWHIVGYWHEPFTYWNETGVYPGVQMNGVRSRYGYMDADNWLLLSEYDGKGVSRLRSLRKDQFRTAPQNHIWDPGLGGVAVSRKGSRPYIVMHQRPSRDRLFDHLGEQEVITRWIEGPPGVIQLSGPTMDTDGRIAVSGNSAGNWDIWLYNGTWHRITTSPSIEMDPWFEEGGLIFASNITGRFQIHAHDMRQLTQADVAAILPRGQTYLELGPGGWFPDFSSLYLASMRAEPPVGEEAPNLPKKDAKESPRPYSPWKSLMPNYILPDLFTDLDSLQLGFATEGRDVTGRYAFDTGVRYDFDAERFSFRLGGRSGNWIARATRYPFGYTTGLETEIREIRHDFKIGWLPLKENPLELSLNWRYFKPSIGERQSGDEWWGAVHFPFVSGNWRVQTVLDLFSGGSQSLYGTVAYHSGMRLKTLLQLEAGKTWGDLVAGHNTFRIGGDAIEGYFTQRPTRVFPVRGFDRNILDAGQFATAGIETFFPLIYLQSGYKTLPLFLRNISVGAFVDSGIASDHFSTDDLLVGAGIELLTGMQLAWGYDANFRISLAWPVRQPSYLDQSGPTLIVQLGKPL